MRSCALPPCIHTVVLWYQPYEPLPLEKPKAESVHSLHPLPIEPWILFLQLYFCVFYYNTAEVLNLSIFIVLSLKAAWFGSALIFIKASTFLSNEATLRLIEVTFEKVSLILKLFRKFSIRISDRVLGIWSDLPILVRYELVSLHAHFEPFRDIIEKNSEQ